MSVFYVVGVFFYVVRVSPNVVSVFYVASVLYTRRECLL